MVTAVQRLRVLIFRERDAWVAQCLEHDVAAQGEDLVSLRVRLCDMLKAYHRLAARLGFQPVDLLGPAPTWYQELARGASALRNWNFRVLDQHATLAVELAPVVAA